MLAKYVNVSKSPLAASLRNRIEVFKLQDLANMTYLKYINNQLLSGKAAYINNRLTLIYNILEMNDIFNLDNLMVENVHISKDGGSDDQYFMLYPSTTSSSMVETFNV